MLEIIIGCCLVLCVIVGWLFIRQRVLYSSLKVQLALKEELLKEKELQLKNIKEEAMLQKSQLEEHYQRLLENQQKFAKESLESLEGKFDKNLKETQQNFLNQNKLQISEDSKKILDSIFTPIKQSIDDYSKQLIKNEESLKVNIDHIFKYTQNIGDKADKLASVLKGDKKIRGNFGELQLKNVLEQSGLKEGEQYKLQESLRDENNNRYAPDAIIYLSKDRSIVVDSKFSLPSFDESSDYELLSKEIAKNIKARIDELSKKPYAYIANAHEFTLLFLPYQNLLDLALDSDSSIYQYAYLKKVYLTTPNTLFIALKTIDATWIKINSNTNVLKAFKEIENFYDKFSSILDDFDKVKKTINTLVNASEDMDKKLSSGKGNLANRFDNLKTLGLKVQKEIKQDYLKE
ncbi:DNA recombination protein RmuC [Helicobacter sp. WB40]|uniref:DNA recombination protein RmuC n=1 Tax=Helicobacter sp. WB40 TaxID=3004130 RepID=UPI0022EBBC90|nr:DNA recombination protein RmuC [Helicobacter sp. WB40]MDA3966862.1 DNA recombination protein RmuC [Helicobacter sp. WB40]